jgi:hypothetical protein
LQDQWKKMVDTKDNSTSYWLDDNDKYKVGIHEHEWPVKVSTDDLKEGNHYFRLTDNGQSHYYNADEDRWTDSATPSDFLDNLSDKWNNLIQSAQDYATTLSDKDKADTEVVQVANEHNNTAKDEIVATKLAEAEKKKEQVDGDHVIDILSQDTENPDNVPTVVVDHGPLGKEVKKEYTLTLKAGETYEVTELGNAITNISPETMIICSSDCNEQREMGSVATLEISSDLNQLLRTIEIFWLGGIANPSTGVSDLPLISIISGNDGKYNQVSMYYETKYALNISHVSNENLEQIKNFFSEKEIPYQ